METDRLAVERVSGRSTVTRCFSKYPLKFIVPTKAGPSEIDIAWIHNLTYGSGIVYMEDKGYIRSSSNHFTQLIFYSQLLLLI
ncbi:hypothetical protein HanIR_Chr10g0496091 [Helianthus annuus]|nr:hypothetical protein HanIR_Chr10g0496091 [Helianthus annuus]